MTKRKHRSVQGFVGEGVGVVITGGVGVSVGTGVGVKVRVGGRVIVAVTVGGGVCTPVVGVDSA